MGEIDQVRDWLARRREASDSKLQTLVARLDEAKKFAGDNACVYVTGSFGRREASERSDLDLFIVGESREILNAETNEKERLPRLRNLDGIRLKAKLIEAAEAAGLPEFDSDGEYLESYVVEDLVQTLGRREDDAANTFTARLLLLLESRPLLSSNVYDTCIDRVLAKYWRDAKDHPNFNPAFLANDILRLWRTFCVNYEAKTKDEPDDEKAKRKLKNFKLKHSRMLTCYSALAYMLALFTRNDTFSVDDARAMVKRTPTERLENLLDDERFGVAHEPIGAVLRFYQEFLVTTDTDKESLLESFQKAEEARQMNDKANRIGDEMLKVLEALGKGSSLYRMIVV
jgi:predicted nucleotidyltransferase